MARIIHSALIVVIRDRIYDPEVNLGEVPVPDIEAFRTQIPQPLQHLLVGPIESLENGYHTYFWAPDGAEERSELSASAKEWRLKFANLFTFRYQDGSSPYELVTILFGSESYSSVAGPIPGDLSSPTEEGDR